MARLSGSAERLGSEPFGSELKAELLAELFTECSPKMDNLSTQRRINIVSPCSLWLRDFFSNLKIFRLTKPKKYVII
ncbi:MAG: hypothetical protein Q7J55_02695 [bacterium]|nr:hypothetical protein [bacterium]